MRVTSVKLFNFRNYQKLQTNFSKNINIIYGNNAQGKTNFLESIYYAAFGFSYRTRNDEELVKFQENSMLAEIEFCDNYGNNALTIKKSAKKEMLLNGNRLSAKEHYGVLNVVLFSPEDLQLIKGEPNLRRKFLNMEIAQTNKLYYEYLVRYNKVLLQRNKFLKSSEDGQIDSAQLDVWDGELAQAAAKLMPYRLDAVNKLKKIARKIYSHLTEEEEAFSLAYALKNNNGFEENTDFSIDWQAWYLDKLQERRSLDIFRRSTSVGPHRDDLVIKVNGKNLKSFGSQGQQRSGALALKLAELEFIKAGREEYPVLLLDDVMSELDIKRRRQLLNFINDKIQTFITVNDKTLIYDLPQSDYFYVESGHLAKENI